MKVHVDFDRLEQVGHGFHWQQRPEDDRYGAREGLGDVRVELLFQLFRNAARVSPDVDQKLVKDWGSVLKSIISVFANYDVNSP